MRMGASLPCLCLCIDSGRNAEEFELLASKSVWRGLGTLGTVLFEVCRTTAKYGQRDQPIHDWRPELPHLMKARTATDVSDFSIDCSDGRMESHAWPSTYYWSRLATMVDGTHTTTTPGREEGKVRQSKAK